MARPKRICSIEGCGKPQHGGGYCAVHYGRWRRNGDPLAGGTVHGAPTDFLESVAASFNGDECLIWPFGKTLYGYGQIRRGGKMLLVHRVVCEIEHGPPPTPEHQAAHKCGKGHEGCCNRKHLRWATPKENQSDRLIHGTDGRGRNNGWAKLTDAQVLAIRSSPCTQMETAELFGIRQSTVSDIISRRRWSHI